MVIRIVIRDCVLGNVINDISNHLASILSYDPSERDMILMRHDVSI